MGDLFLNKTLICFFIKTLTEESAFRYLNYFGYDFSLQQIKIILPYLKNNLDKLENKYKKYLIDNLPSNVSSYSKFQLIKLFDQYIKKEG